MCNQGYKNQVHLLLSVLPEVAKEQCFALHGGTAINLFVREMPRLSVDIDLTYVPVEDRITSLFHINEALSRILARIRKRMPDSHIVHNDISCKLHIRSGGVEIKIEVNLINRGTIHAPNRMLVCDTAQHLYEVAAVMPVVPLGQLYGGKICAALNRQHPRDLFDIKFLLDNEGFTDEIREGFLLCLLSSDRPIHEVLSPHFLDQHLAMENQFAGMSDHPFTYDDYEQTRNRLITLIKQSLTKTEKIFLLNVKNCTPNWDLHDFAHFPAVQWKLHNLQKLKVNNPYRHQESYEMLEQVLAN